MKPLGEPFPEAPAALPLKGALAAASLCGRSALWSQ